jgi:hypothetical protein
VFQVGGAVSFCDHPHSDENDRRSHSVAAVAATASACRRELGDVKIETGARGTARITGIEVPDGCRYLILSTADGSMDAPAELPVTL